MLKLRLSFKLNYFAMQIIVVQNPIPVMPKPVVPLERPSGDEPLQRLKVTVGASLKEQLEKLKLEEKQDCDLSGKMNECAFIEVFSL